MDAKDWIRHGLNPHGEYPPGVPQLPTHFHTALPIAADGSWQSRPEHVSRTGRKCPSCAWNYTVMVANGAVYCADCGKMIELPIQFSQRYVVHYILSAPSVGCPWENGGGI